MEHRQNATIGTGTGPPAEINGGTKKTMASNAHQQRPHVGPHAPAMKEKPFF